ncbi:MAG: LysM peptidoglycan-binding domain-containing protein [Anaerolineales bacterium]|nr:LysM peptidoglycan-binding domain-containing protein [Anaerolineales bacterium]
MTRKINLSLVVILLLMASFLRPADPAQATPPQAPADAPFNQDASAYELILAMNTLRVSFGLPALIEDPIINAVAQNTAQTMAANNMSWHIGDVRGRLQAAGYGGGATVWATENFAVGTGMGIDQIMVVWADAEHMRPATTPAYCHVGAGVASAGNGRFYYVLQAAYVAGQACGATSSGGNGGTSGGGTGSDGGITVPQFITPVKIATPDADGKIYHTVEFGQSFWSIAIAYQITIADLEYWNNLTREQELLVGQKLFIPTQDTEGYATPTPVGMVILSTPDADGKIIHEVQSYQTLSSIAAAYTVNLDSLLNFNGWNVDWPLQIGQSLIISPGKILSPLQRLTPDADGNYYHTVQSGETLSGIATAYNLNLTTLMSWNGLNSDSTIFPGQKLLLQVTPPAPPTATPSPITPTLADSAPAEPAEPTPSPSTLPRTPTPLVQQITTPPASPAKASATNNGPIALILGAGGLMVLLLLIFRKRPEPTEK